MQSVMHICVQLPMYAGNMALPAVGEKEGTVRHRQSKEASILLWSRHEETKELPRERVNARQETMPSARRRGKLRTAWMVNIKTWTGLSVEESIRMTEDSDKWRKYVHGVANPRIDDG